MTDENAKKVSGFLRGSNVLNEEETEMLDWLWQMKKERDILYKATSFIMDLCEEELPHAKVGTGGEVALRHAARRAREAIGQTSGTKDNQCSPN